MLIQRLPTNSSFGTSGKEALEFKEMWGGRPDEDGTVILHAQCRLREFC
jgi:hypothetical protein